MPRACASVWRCVSSVRVMRFACAGTFMRDSQCLVRGNTLTHEVHWFDESYEVVHCVRRRTHDASVLAALRSNVMRVGACVGCAHASAQKMNTCQNSGTHKTHRYWWESWSPQNGSLPFSNFL